MNFKCEKTNHKQSQIILFCLNELCQQSKLICDKCIQQEIHAGHYKDLVRFQDMNDFLVKRSQECDQFINFIQQQIDSSQELLNKIKVGLRQKYQINEERQKQLNYQQLSQAILEIIQFFNKKKQMEQQLNGGIMNLNLILENIYSSIGLDNLTYKNLSDIEKQKAKVFYDEGYQLYCDNKNYEQAITKLDQSLNINNFDHLTLWCKGECLRMCKKYNEALSWLDKALDIDSKRVNALYSKGDCLRMLNKYNEALIYLDKALDIDPNHVNSFSSKGDCLKMLNKYSEALICLEKALHIDPNHVNSLSCKGDCLRLLGKKNEALICLDQCLEINPNEGAAICSKALTLQELKRFEAAIVWFDKASNHLPNWQPIINGKILPGAIKDQTMKHFESKDKFKQYLYNFSNEIFRFQFQHAESESNKKMEHEHYFVRPSD